MTIVLVIEAIKRVEEPEPIDGTLMIIIACIGFLANLLMLKIMGGHGHSHGGHSHGGELHLEKESDKSHAHS